MIPFQYALFAYIPVCLLLMMDRDHVRGFSLCFLGALLFMPAGEKVDLPGIPDLEKDNVWIVGVMLGTIIFHPTLIWRFRIQMADLFLFGVVGMAIMTSVFNGFGLYDGLSRGFEFGFNFACAVFISRVHLERPTALRRFLQYLTLGAMFYAPLALYEFRMSPQIHTWTYGYFQHVFSQHQRGNFWRPIVYFPHGLVLGRYFAFTAFLALFSLRTPFTQRFGSWGRLVFVLPLLGLMASQSYGPIMLFFILGASHFILPRFRWAGVLMPVAALWWMVLIFVGDHPGHGIVQFVEGIDIERAASLDYRLVALQEYRDVVLQSLWYGHGGWNSGRIEGLATDSQALVNMLDRGLIGTCLFYAWWVAATLSAYRMIRRTEGWPLQPSVVAVAAMAGSAIAMTSIDAAFEQPIIIALASVTAIEAWMPDPAALHAVATSIPRFASPQQLRAAQAAG